jgi:apolipoprotein N-acyltransferase
MAAVNATLAALVTPALRGRRFAASSIVIAVLVATTLGYGASRLATPVDGGTPVRVALLQPAIAASERRSVDARARALAWQLEAPRDAVARPRLPMATRSTSTSWSRRRSAMRHDHAPRA